MIHTAHTKKMIGVLVVICLAIGVLCKVSNCVGKNVQVFTDIDDTLKIL